MSQRSTRPLKRMSATGGALLAAALVLVGCTSNDPAEVDGTTTEFLGAGRRRELQRRPGRDRRDRLLRAAG